MIKHKSFLFKKGPSIQGKGVVYYDADYILGVNIDVLYCVGTPSFILKTIRRLEGDIEKKLKSMISNAATK